MNDINDKKIKNEKTRLLLLLIILVFSIIFYTRLHQENVQNIEIFEQYN